MVALLGLALGSGCTAAGYAEQADEEVETVLAQADATALADREGWIRQPEPSPKEPEEATEEAGEGLVGEAEGEPDLVISLGSALKAGFTTAREYLTRQEDLYVSGLGLSLTRFQFGPQLDATLFYLWGNSENAPANHRTGAEFGLSQILPSGGTFRLASGLTTARVGGPHFSDPDNGRSWSSNVDFNLSQPLMRGAGYDVAWESLTQAERTILYQVRNFELFREDHAISIIADYYGLVSQRRQLANTRRNYEDAVYDREKSVAQRQVERITEEDLIQTRRREVNARNDLLVAETDYAFSLDAFRIRLGLPDADTVTLGEEVLPFEKVRLDADSAVEVALYNRLDLLTAKERVEDTARQLGISRNGLLPDVNIDLGYGRDGSAGDFGRATPPDDWRATAGLRIDLPIQRLPERNSYRTALINYDQAVRNYELLLQNTERDVRDALRNLDQLEEQISLAEQQIRQDERAVAVTQIRYEAGEIDARELLDSRQSLVNSQNGLIAVQVSHFIARLRLYRNLGLLFIEADGSWRA